jgi:hypothetical protein
MLEELKNTFDKPQITLAEAARYLHRDPRTLLADRTFPIKKKGGRWMISLVALARYMGS